MNEVELCTTSLRHHDNSRKEINKPMFAAQWPCPGPSQSSKHAVKRLRGVTINQSAELHEQRQMPVQAMRMAFVQPMNASQGSPTQSFQSSNHESNAYAPRMHVHVGECFHVGRHSVTKAKPKHPYVESDTNVRCVKDALDNQTNHTSQPHSTLSPSVPAYLPRYSSNTNSSSTGPPLLSGLSRGEVWLTDLSFVLPRRKNP